MHPINSTIILTTQTQPPKGGFVLVARRFICRALTPVLHVDYSANSHNSPGNLSPMPQGSSSSPPPQHVHILPHQPPHQRPRHNRIGAREHSQLPAPLLP